MKKNVFGKLLICLVAVALVTGPTRLPAESPRPNVVTFLLDDLDIASFQALVNRGSLPNIKALMGRGVTFSNSFVSNAVCAPSRATFLTGQYSKNNGVINLAAPGYSAWAAPGSTTESKTLPVALEKGGYRTGHVGKYLNGYESKPVSFIPPGYDFWVGLRGNKAYQVYEYEVSENGKARSFTSSTADYQTDVLANYAANFVKATDSRPFSLVVTPIPPHLEVLPIKNVAQIVTDASIFSPSVRPARRHLEQTDKMPPPDSLKKASFSDYSGIELKPLHVTLQPTLTADDEVEASRQYRERLASMLAVDELVGKVVAALGSKLANTYLILTSDNGYLFGEHRLTSKLVPYEESVRVPLVIAGPGLASNVTSASMALNNDLAPTIAELTQVNLILPPDGRSLVSHLRNPAVDLGRKQFLVEHYEDTPVPEPVLTANPGLQEVYLKSQIFTYKAIRRIDDSSNLLYAQWYEGLSDKTVITHRELYDLKADPLQMRNLALDPTLSPELKAKIDIQVAEFEETVRRFSSCAGSSCRSVEDQAN